MKKFLMPILLFILCFCFSGCDPTSFYFDYDELTSEVTSIELINYDNLNQKSFNSWVPNHFSDLAPFELNNMTVLETLDEEDIPEFLEQLSEVYFLSKYYVYDSPKDICIRLIYTNDDFEVISCDYERGSFYGYVGRYNSSGDVVDFVGSFEGLPDFEALVNNYFDTQLS